MWMGEALWRSWGWGRLVAQLREYPSYHCLMNGSLSEWYSFAGWDYEWDHEGWVAFEWMKEG